jgi:2-oxoisovalerate dehydrogenase E1 component beta subunit
MNMIQALNSAMDIMLGRDPSVVLMGEDIGYFGGVFRTTEGLQRKYGEHRVLDTPIAEGGIVGAAIGMASMVCGRSPRSNSPITSIRASIRS